MNKLGRYFTLSREKGYEGLPLLSVTLDNGLVRRDLLDRRTETNLKADEHLLVKENYIAYNMMRVWQGALGRATEDGLVSPAYVVLKPKESVNSVFMEYFFKSHRMIYLFWAYSYGLTNDRLRLYYKDFKNIPVNIPPLAEQEKIAEILSTWDHAIEQTERLKTNAEMHKKALMQQLLSGKKRFPEFGGEWEEVRLGDVSLIDSGFAFKSQDFLNTSCDGNYVNVIRMSDLKSGVLDREDVARVSKEIIKGLDKYELKQNDFVFGMSGSLSNYAWVKQNDLPCYLNQRVGRIRAKEGVNSLFIHYLYLSDKTKYFIQSIAAGAAQLNISIKDLRNLKVYIPLDLGEQQKIASVLNTADREIELLTQKIEHLKIEKRALMQQLLTGKRRVKV